MSYRTATTPSQKAGWSDALIAFLLIPFGATLQGWIIHVIWNWFIPQITGWSNIGIVQGLGIACMISVLTRGLSRSKDDAYESRYDFWVAVGAAYLGTLFLLGYAWVIHLFL